MHSRREELAMSNKKFNKLAVLSLLGVLALAGCDSSSSEIYAKPSDYKDEIVTIDGNKDKIQNDILSVIYDAMHEGAVPEKVLEKVLYKYAESVFGVYNKVTAKGEDVITLEEAAAIGSTKTKDFIRQHKAYWLYNDDGEHINDNGEVVKDDKNFEPCATEYKNVTSKWESIETRIKEQMFETATSATYTNKHFFKEIELVKYLYKEGKKVNYAAASTASLTPLFVDYQLEAEDVFSTLLHRSYYQDAGNKITYVEDELIPSIYNDLLVEQYLLDEELSAVRNSRARKINVIKIEKYSSFSNNADLLVKDLVDAIYSDAPAANGHLRTKTSSENDSLDTIEKHYSDLFDLYAVVNKGLYNEIQSNTAAKEIVERLNQIASDVYEEDDYNGIKFYNNTAYGDLIKDYKKFKDATTFEELDMTLYNKFTSSGTTTDAEGLDQATIDIDQKETITKGWFIQNSEPSLDSNGTINDRLFKLSVANNKIEVGGEDDYNGSDAELIAQNLEDVELNVDRYAKKYTNSAKTTWEWTLRDEPSSRENKYICSINGAYFLKFEGQSTDDDYRNDIVYDDGSAYYIVNVLEAVKDSKLRGGANNNSSYAKLRGTAFLNTVIDEISKKVAETGSYASLSKEYWLKKMNIKYHDQDVYDYFKENYPDLFD